MLMVLVKMRKSVKIYVIYVEFCKSKLPLFHIFHGKHEFSFLEKIFMFIKKHYSLIFFINFIYLSRTKSELFLK